MASKDEIKAVFVTGAKPTQQDFHDLIDVAGEKGDTGERGPAGEKGADGTNGTDGADGVGIADIKREGNDLVFTMTDETEKTVALPDTSPEA